MQTTGDVTTQLMDAHETSRHYQRGRDGGWWGCGGKNTSRVLWFAISNLHAITRVVDRGESQ